MLKGASRLETKLLNTKTHYKSIFQHSKLRQNTSFQIRTAMSNHSDPSPTPPSSTSQKYSLESTLETLESLIHFQEPKNLRKMESKQQTNIEAMTDYIKRLNLDISKLSVIHVAGTKGKGSTSAFCESILRSAGYKTGLYTSPHLIDVKERIRINGDPIDSSKFIRHFWDIYEGLENTKTEFDQSSQFPSMATYFRILTLIGLKAFIEEKVDVAILEVGLGGRLDATNVLRYPVVCGITSLGYDHMNILGNTLSQIAWEKAGIMKPGVPAITCTQKDEAMRILVAHAKKIGTDLSLAPSLDQFEQVQTENNNNNNNNNNKNERIRLGIAGDHQRLNASLALALCDTWLKRKDSNKEFLEKLTKKDGDAASVAQATATWIPSVGAPDTTNLIARSELNLEPVELPKAFPVFKPNKEQIQGLASCFWPGRGQVIEPTDKRSTFYIDGAHTDESLAFCATWFKQSVRANEKNSSGMRHLVFNCTEDRDPLKLLQPFIDLEDDVRFDTVFFCPPEFNKGNLGTKSQSPPQQNLKWQEKMSEIWKELEAKRTLTTKQTRVIVEANLNNVLDQIEASTRESTRNQVLVTGSFYLVGDLIRKVSKQ